MSDAHADIPGLLSGELSPSERDTAVRHVRGCPECRDQLVETSALVAELREAGRYAPVDPAEVPPLRLHEATGVREPVVERATAEVTKPRHGWLAGRTAVAVMVGVVALAAGLVIGRAQPHPAPPARVALAAVGTLPSTASGAAQMSGAGQQQTMNLSVSGLRTPPPGDHYEVWLLDTRTGRTLDVGRISTSATGVMSFPLPARELAGFDALDISLQAPANGNRHSGDSLLRGSLA